jgi:hypothetical protein
MPTKREWRTAFVVGLFLFGPGLERYLRDRASTQGSQSWTDFYAGLADIVQRAGTDPDRALELADKLYDGIWGRPKRRALPQSRAR